MWLRIMTIIIIIIIIEDHQVDNDKNIIKYITVHGTVAIAEGMLEFKDLMAGRKKQFTILVGSGPFPWI